MFLHIYIAFMDIYGNLLKKKGNVGSWRWEQSDVWLVRSKINYFWGFAYKEMAYFSIFQLRLMLIWRGTEFTYWMECFLSVGGNPKPEWLLIKMRIEFAFPPTIRSSISRWEFEEWTLRNTSGHPFEKYIFPMLQDSRVMESRESLRMTRSQFCVTCFHKRVQNVC